MSRTDAILRVFNDILRPQHRQIPAQAVDKIPDKLRVRPALHNRAIDLWCVLRKNLTANELQLSFKFLPIVL